MVDSGCLRHFALVLAVLLAIPLTHRRSCCFELCFGNHTASSTYHLISSTFSFLLTSATASVLCQILSGDSVSVFPVIQLHPLVLI
ncbi:hypothetical protein C8R45DRAFT_971357 [Mycena sanguinolenta]|nr:hypothetical protein C8R45DRAFT_971357 [Mycena sanguinolenta]